MSNKKQAIFAISLITTLLVVSFAVYFIIEAMREDGAYVRVSVDGEAVAEYSLSKDGEYEINGGTNILVIENKNAYMKYASCPDGLCKNQGKIHLTGERIVCLPNRVFVEVFGTEDEIIPN